MHREFLFTPNMGFCPQLPSFPLHIERSIPKPVCRQISSLPHGFELLPHDTGVHFGLIKRLRGEPTVRPGHHILPSDQLGEANEPLSNPFGMFDDVTCMRDDAWAEHFPLGQFHPLEQVIFVFMSRVRSFEAERAGIDLENVFNDLRQIRFVDTGSLINAVARVKTNTLGRNAAQRLIRCFNINLRSPLLLLLIKPWLHKDIWQERIVHL